MEFVLGIIAISTIGWLANNWIRARHGYDLEDEWGGKTARAGRQAARTLEAKVEQLADQVEDYRDRTRVLERIVTDNGFVTAAQIEALRDE
ncbi:MAG TPA: hypothetical protein VML75_23745, partial [Kofleriaceae bacterium]|nr:hypothetical protein [Kofleriaceae bacterium]